MRTQISIVAAALLVSACGSQDTLEPIATLRGTVNRPLSMANATTEGHLVLAWYDHVPEEHTYANSLGIEAALPMEFAMPIFAPPDAAYHLFDQIDEDGTLLNSITQAVARIAAVSDPDAPFESPNIIGMSAEHIIVCERYDVPAGSHYANVIGGALEAGCHLVHVDTREPETVALREQCLADGLPIAECDRSDVLLDTYRPEPAGFAQPVTVELFDDDASSRFPRLPL